MAERGWKVFLKKVFLNPGSRWRQPWLLLAALVPALVCVVLLLTPRSSIRGVIGFGGTPPAFESPATSGLPTPQSACVVQEDGSVLATPRPAAPFLFDTESMPLEKEVCSHCPGIFALPILCCGVCQFENRQCDTFYPGGNKTQLLLESYSQEGRSNIGGLSPCEFFQRIRGRTLYFFGDSQTWHFFYSAECFLREFAKGVQRSYLVSDAARRHEIVTVTWPFNVPGICMDLEAGTRVCALRVDSAATLATVVLPKLAELVPRFAEDGILIFNTGLHYGHGFEKMDAEMQVMADYVEGNRGALPPIIWMDTPPQHFDAPLGEFPSGGKPYNCTPLEGWYKGDPLLLSGGSYNRVAAKHLARFATAHLQTWNASVPLWDSHKPLECTHWCSPGAYHIWLHLLNNVLRDSQLGSPVQVSYADAAPNA